jgi:hypothetical protein
MNNSKKMKPMKEIGKEDTKKKGCGIDKNWVKTD